MPEGTVKWFDQVKCYGFIEPKEDGPDLFVHKSNVEGTIRDGDTVKFDVLETDKGPNAINVKLIKSAPKRDKTEKGRRRRSSQRKKRKSTIDYNSMTVVKLKEILRERGLKVSGTKDELIDRLKEDDKPKKKPKKKSFPQSGWKGGIDDRMIIEKLKLPLTAPFSSLSDPLKVEFLTEHLESTGPILITWFRDSLTPDSDESKFSEIRGEMEKKSANFTIQVAEKFPDLTIRLFDWPDIHRSHGDTKRSTHPYISFICRAAVIVAPLDYQLKDETPFKNALTEAVHSDLLHRSKEKWVLVGDETGDLSEFTGKPSDQVKRGINSTMCWLAIPPNTNLSPLPLDFHCSGQGGLPHEQLGLSNILEHEQVLCFTFPFEQGLVIEAASDLGQDSHLSLWQHTLPLVLEYVSSLTTKSVPVDIFIEQVGLLESGIGIIQPIAAEFLDALGHRKGWRNITFDQLWVLSKSPLEHPWIGYPDALGSCVHDVKTRNNRAMKPVERLRERTISTPYRQDSLNGAIRQALKDTARPLVFLRSLSDISSNDMRDYIERFFSSAITESLASLNEGEWEELLEHMDASAKNKQGQNATSVIHGHVDIKETLETMSGSSVKMNFLLAMLGTSNHIGAISQANLCESLITDLLDDGYIPKPDRMKKLENLSGGSKDNVFDFTHIHATWLHTLPEDPNEVNDETVHYLGAQAQSRGLRAEGDDWEEANLIEDFLRLIPTNEKNLLRRWVLKAELQMDDDDHAAAMESLEEHLPAVVSVDAESLRNDPYYCAALLKCCALSARNASTLSQYAIQVSSLLDDRHPSQRIAYWCARWAYVVGLSDDATAKRCCEHLLELTEKPLFTHNAPGIILACELLDLKSRSMIDFDAEGFLADVLKRSQETTRDWVDAHQPSEEDWLAPLNFNYR